MLTKNESSLLEPSLFCVKAILILDNDGHRVLGKYYDDTFPTAKEKKAFERNLFNKTHRVNGEIIMLDGLTCVYKSSVDLFFYVMGSANENGLILLNVLTCFYDAVFQILRKNVEKRYLMDNLDVIILALDEICDRGIILENDSASIVQRVVLKNDDLPIGEQTVAQVFQNAKENFKWSLLRS